MPRPKGLPKTGERQKGGVDKIKREAPPGFIVAATIGLQRVRIAREPPRAHNGRHLTGCGSDGGIETRNRSELTTFFRTNIDYFASCRSPDAECFCDGGPRTAVLRVNTPPRQWHPLAGLFTRERLVLRN